MFDLEGAPQPAGTIVRDLTIEATIIDIKEIATHHYSSSNSRLHSLCLTAAAGHRRSVADKPTPDAVSGLAEALAEVLEGTGARVVIRAPLKGAAVAKAAVPPAERCLGAFVLRGSFLVVKGAAEEDDRGIIIDPSFREAFRIAPATPGYHRLVEALPEAFVGDTSALRRLVALVTAQAARSYRSQGLTPPPWRSYRAMMARWCPPRVSYTDIIVSPPGSPLARLNSDEAAALALTTARAAVQGALARLATVTGPASAWGAPAWEAGGRGAGAHGPRGGGGGPPAPARVVRGFEVAAAN